ncbi:hypothetical protein EG68_00895 [Paragonimus skrjabini miyazakii]|uniref:Cadherin domain-containing protein n=1 Tax=Paragonimus skrjabini miyazakii TaxID=59628 RepID=A0A8S9Z885_9TREM|nr:hypothetical protein EG68_00895 [Paragonimus skrjabini miyazakii]
MNGRAVGKVIAVDADSPTTECGEIVYELKQDKHTYLFTIDKLTGEIRFELEKRLINHQDSYGVNVLARNTGVFSADLDETFVEIVQHERLPDNLVSPAIVENTVEKLVRRKRAVVNPLTELTFQIAKLPPATTEDMCIGCSWKVQLTVGIPSGTRSPTIELFGAMNDTIAFGFVRNVVLKSQGSKITSTITMTTSAIGSTTPYGVTHLSVVLGQLQVSNTAGTATSDFEVVLEYETGLSSVVSLAEDAILTGGAGALLDETLWIGVMNIRVKSKSPPKFTLKNCPATARPGDVIYISLSAFLPFAAGDYSFLIESLSTSLSIADAEVVMGRGFQSTTGDITKKRTLNVLDRLALGQSVQIDIKNAKNALANDVTASEEERGMTINAYVQVSPFASTNIRFYIISSLPDGTVHTETCDATVQMNTTGFTQNADVAIEIKSGNLTVDTEKIYQSTVKMDWTAGSKQSYSIQVEVTGNPWADLGQASVSTVASSLSQFTAGDRVLPSVELTRHQPKSTDPMAKTGTVFMMVTTFKELQVYKPVTLRMEFDQPDITIWDARIYQVGNCLDSFVPAGLRFMQKGNTLDWILPSIFITCVSNSTEAGITLRVVVAQMNDLAYNAMATVYVNQQKNSVTLPVTVNPFATQPPLAITSVPAIDVNLADAFGFNINNFRTNMVNLLFATITIKPEARTTYQFDVSTTQTPAFLRICAPRLLNFDGKVGFHTDPASVTGNKILMELGFLYHDDRSLTVEPGITTAVHGLTYAVPIIPKGPVSSSADVTLKVNYDNSGSTKTLTPTLIAGPTPTVLPALTNAGLLNTFDYNKLSTRPFSSSLAPGETVQIFYYILIRNTMCVSYTIHIDNSNDDTWPVELGTAFVQAHGDSVWCIDTKLKSTLTPSQLNSITSEVTFNLGEVCTSDTTDSWVPVITSDAAALSAKPGEEIVIPLKMKVPPGAILPDSNLQFDCEKTALLDEAQCTILKIQLSGGVNLVGMDREPFEQVVTSSFNNGQNNSVSVSLGTVVQTGITHALGLIQLDADVLTASVTLRLADSKNSNQGTRIPFKISAKFGDFSVGHTEEITVNRDGSETVSLEFLLDLITPAAPTRATAGDTVEFRVTQRMLPASRLECAQQTLQIHLDDMFQNVKLKSQLTGVSQFTASPSSVDPKISEFQAGGFYFGQNQTMTFSMTVNPSMHFLHGSATLDATLLVELQCMTYERVFLPPVIEAEGRPARFVSTAVVPLADASGCFEDLGLTSTLKIQDCQLSSFGFADPKNRVHNIRFNSAQGWKPPVRGGRFVNFRYATILFGSLTNINRIDVRMLSVSNKVLKLDVYGTTDGRGYFFHESVSVKYSTSDTGMVMLVGALNAHGIRLVVAQLEKENDETEFVIDLWGCLKSTSIRTFDLGPVVSQILTYLPDTNALFAIGVDQQSLMQSDDLGQTWYGINRFRYQMRVVRSPLAVNATSLPWSVQPGKFDSSTTGTACTAFVAGDWYCES